MKVLNLILLFQNNMADYQTFLFFLFQENRLIYLLFYRKDFPFVESTSGSLFPLSYN